MFGEFEFLQVATFCQAAPHLQVTKLGRKGKVSDWVNMTFQSKEVINNPK